MASLKACPRCGRRVKESLTVSHFVVHTCRKCQTKFCSQCSGGGSTTCPKCGSTSHSDYDKVYA